MKCLSETPVIASMFGAQLDNGLAPILYEQRGSFLAAYFAMLSDMATTLSQFSGEDITTLLARVNRGPNPRYSVKDCAMEASSAFIWLAMFNPYTKEQTHFTAAERLLDALKKDGEAYKLWSLFVIATPSRAIYIDILRVSPKCASEYLSYCVGYAYSNPGLEEHCVYISEDEAGIQQSVPPEEDVEGGVGV